MDTGLFPLLTAVVGVGTWVPFMSFNPKVLSVPLFPQLVIYVGEVKAFDYQTLAQPGFY
jgi:hypothetical protein